MKFDVSDSAYEQVLFYIADNPMASMVTVATRTGIGYRTVCKAVRLMVAEKAIVRTRIGKGTQHRTYANMVQPSRLYY
jgi:hypothetical protein